jgi:hypothetical protein
MLLSSRAKDFANPVAIHVIGEANDGTVVTAAFAARIWDTVDTKPRRAGIWPSRPRCREAAHRAGHKRRHQPLDFVLRRNRIAEARRRTLRCAAQLFSRGSHYAEAVDTTRLLSVRSERPRSRCAGP